MWHLLKTSLALAKLPLTSLQLKTEQVKGIPALLSTWAVLLKEASPTCPKYIVRWLPCSSLPLSNAANGFTREAGLS